MYTLGFNPSTHTLHRVDNRRGTAECASGYRVNSRSIQLAKMFSTDSVKEYFEKVIELHESKAELCGRCYSAAAIARIKTKLAEEWK